MARAARLTKMNKNIKQRAWPANQDENTKSTSFSWLPKVWMILSRRFLQTLTKCVIGAITTYTFGRKYQNYKNANFPLQMQWFTRPKYKTYQNMATIYQNLPKKYKNMATLTKIGLNWFKMFNIAQNYEKIPQITRND